MFHIYSFLHTKTHAVRLYKIHLSHYVVHLELTVKITPDFINELLLQSRGMRVIEPLHLRDTLVGIHRETIGLLG